MQQITYTCDICKQHIPTGTLVLNGIAVSMPYTGKLHKLSEAKMKINVTFEGAAQHNIYYNDFTTELYALAKRYHLYVTSYDVPPMRFLNKYELDELKESQIKD